MPSYLCGYKATFVVLLICQPIHDGMRKWHIVQLKQCKQGVASRLDLNGYRPVAVPVRFGTSAKWWSIRSPVAEVCCWCTTKFVKYQFQLVTIAICIYEYLVKKYSLSVWD